MSAPDFLLLADRRVFAEFDIEPADLAYLRSVHATLTPEIQDWVVAQWRAEVEALPWFEALGLAPEQEQALADAVASLLARLLSGDRVEELSGEVERAALVALWHGVKNTDLFQASTKLESILTGVILQLFSSPDQQTVALVTVSKFLKSLLYVVMETYRRAAAAEIEGRNRELAEALEQQTATAEVLHVISSAPGDLTPVFDAMIARARQLCEADFAVMNRYDGERFLPIFVQGVPAGFAKQLLSRPPQPGRRNALARLVEGEDVVRIDDLRQAPGYRSGDPRSRAIVERGGARSYAIVALRKDGRLLGTLAAYRKSVRPFTDKQIGLLQNFAALTVIAMDNARLLNEIRQHQAELRVIFDNMGDGVAMFDAEMRLAAWNLNFQKMLDLPDELTQSRPTLAQYVDYLAGRGEYETAATEVVAEIQRGAQDADRETRFERTRPDGRVIEVRRNAVPGGGSVLIFGDITERKRSEEKIRTARDAAEAALGDLKAAQGRLIQAEKMASLGQLTAGIAHEIKNPLNFVNNFASLSVELLEELKEVAEPALAGLDEDKRDDLDETIGMLTGNLEKIAEHGRRADNIVKSMLEHSRGVSGERREVDLNALVEESLNLAYHGARAQDQSFNITLERDLDHHLRPIRLVPQDMTRVFLNLFGNGFYAANKRAQQGDETGFRPVLYVATHDCGDAVEVRVRDNGTGIPPDIRDKLFQPFFTTKPTGEGTGLGLSITYDIVTQQHGGTIAVDSEVGQFTEFTVRLPRQRQTRT